MFELGGKRSVPRYRRPAIIQHLHCRAAGVDHRFDGEEHAGFQNDAAPRLADMHDVGRGVEILAQPVPAEIAYHGKTIALGVGLDSVADIAQRLAGPGLLNAQHQAFIGDINQLARLQRHVANQEHAAGVAIPAVHHHRHIDVDDVAALQLFRPWNPVAHDMVHAGAQRVREAAIENRGGCSPGSADEFPRHRVEIDGRHFGQYMRRQMVQHLGGQSAGLAHAFKGGRAMQAQLALMRVHHRGIERLRHPFAHRDLV